MKPRIYRKNGEWLCEYVEELSYIGWGDTPRSAYRMWAWSNRIFTWIPPFHLTADNQDQTRRE